MAVAPIPHRTFLQPLAPPVDPVLLQADIDALPPEAHVAQSSRFSVYAARGNEIPRILAELGRLREATFRLLGEGTGLAADLDEYDPWYTHLFAWDASACAIAGAYRLCRTDPVIAERGIQGLYNSTLFHLDPQLFKRTGPAMELGRAFVQETYQRSPLVLASLWEGIGTLVMRDTRCRRLMGAVSIDQLYRPESIDVMVGFLHANCLAPVLAPLVAAHNPYPLGAGEFLALGAAQRDIQAVSRVVKGLEPDKRCAPVLLRQYLGMGAQALGFNIDNSFNDVDVMIVVDLERAPPRRLARYLGAGAVEQLQRP